MRPRGPSSSSPSSWYVGQVALQKPQCTHLRTMACASSPCGVPSNSGVKCVCTRSELGVQTAGVEDARRIEGLLQSSVNAHQDLAHGRKHCGGFVAPDQCRMPCGMCGRRAHLVSLGTGAPPTLRTVPLDELPARQL